MNDETAGFRDLISILEEGVEIGADSIELECERGGWSVTWFGGHTGFGRQLPKEKARPIIEELYDRSGLGRRSKGSLEVQLLGKDFVVVVQPWESFGEWNYRLRWREAGQEPKKPAPGTAKRKRG